MTETDRVRRAYDRAAPGYDRAIAVAERLLVLDGRAWAAGRATGDVLEIAIGTGRNLAHYPAGVRLTAVDLSPVMLALARQRAAELGLEADLREADATALPFTDVSFDTVVVTLSLCTIPDDAAALREVARVLRPGGELVAVEHVRSPRPLVRGVQRALDPLLRRLDGDHLLREPERRAVEAGLVVEHLERSRLGLVLRLTARKPLAG